MGIVDPSDELRRMYERDLAELRASMGIVGRSVRQMYLIRKVILRAKYSRLIAYW